MKKTVKQLSLGVLTLALAAMWVAEAGATATCFCKISKDSLAGHVSASGVCQDLTSQIGKTYSGVYQQHEDNQVDCNNRCKQATLPLIPSQSVATSCCAIGAPNGTFIHAYSAVGTKAYRSVPSPTDQQIGGGILNNTPAITQTTCPASWLANMTNVPGGVTADGKCKKLSGSISITPLPDNGTPIGSYGFSWGSQIYAWGTQTNGGAAVTTTVTPAVCSF